jgi:hypothetical protein
MNTKGTTLKETTQRRMSEIAQRTVHFTGNPMFTARQMTGLLVGEGHSRTPHTARVCMWMKVHPHFSTIRTGKVLQFKYIGGATA